MKDLAPDIVRQRLLVFFATVLFTCKRFEVNDALRFTRDYFATTELAHRPF
jgi:hypothetical protein